MASFETRVCTVAARLLRGASMPELRRVLLLAALGTSCVPNLGPIPCDTANQCPTGEACVANHCRPGATDAGHGGGVATAGGAGGADAAGGGGGGDAGGG